ncbi:integrase domain-containing protein [Marinobacter salarius]|uniref:integrase domain-containing protein n=1 Tax=Marinobacter salarius TaxID=1420917 RepID=UPI00273BD818|nr:integrase domain-containing protein [Marinobacter salarius]MDP4533528.1 integrase domain-containing protein [Marinobacter salarius]
MSKNFGLGSRSMRKAGIFALKNAEMVGAISFQTSADLGQRWAQFCEFASEHGVRQMEYVDGELVVEYGNQLAARVRENLNRSTAETHADTEPPSIGASTAQNRISAVNTVMTLATQGEWVPISPTSSTQCGISKRTHVRQVPPSGLNRDNLQRALSALDARGYAITCLARELGLRSKEASLLDAKSALDDASKSEAVTIEYGTKGGKPRRVTVISDRQLTALQRAAEAQGFARAVMPAEENWQSWRETGLRRIRETLQEFGIRGIHELRSAYACDRYEQLTGFHAPVLGGNAPTDLDRKARQQISAELGHSRIDITNAYLGGQR